MIQIFTLKEIDLWEEALKTFPHQDIYFYPRYFIPFLNNGDGIPLAFYYESEEGKVLYPFLLRDISKLQVFKNILKSNVYFDISTVYGYGGPLYQCDEENLQLLSKNFYREFEKFALERNIISEFIRFHPILKNHYFSKERMMVEKVRNTVFVDLTKGEEFLWNNFTSSLRNKIRKAIKNQVVISQELTPENLKTFQELYNSTMKKNQAEEYYFFNDNFFFDTVKALKEDCTLFLALKENTIIAGTLIIYGKEYGHYHFSGSEEKFLELAPYNLMLYEVFMHCKKKGLKGVHLGGGHHSTEDSLYTFKKSFTKDPPLDFYIGEKIYNNDIYNFLVNKKVEQGFNITDPCYFPSYRD